MKTQSRKLCIALSLLVAQAAWVSAYATDTSENRGQLSGSDYKFAREAATGGMLEVSLGKLAAERSTNPEVQQFGQRMVTDHGKAGQQLQEIATSKGAVLPTELSSSQQRELEHLSKLSGAEFDKAYVTRMVRDHKTDEKEFKKAAEDASDPQLKTFAANTLPIIQEHLRMAENLEPSTKHEISRNQ